MSRDSDLANKVAAMIKVERIDGTWFVRDVPGIFSLPMPSKKMAVEMADMLTLVVCASVRYHKQITEDPNFPASTKALERRCDDLRERGRIAAIALMDRYIEEAKRPGEEEEEE